MPTQQAPALRIGKVAARANVSATTIRFYERIGLLPAPRRTKTRYRLYSADAIRELKFIRKATGLGLHLHEIRDILDRSRRGPCPCRLVRKVLRKHAAAAARRIRRDAEMRRRLTAALNSRAPGADGSHPGRLCPLIEHQRTYSRPPARTGPEPGGAAEPLRAARVAADDVPFLLAAGGEPPVEPGRPGSREERGA